MTLTTWDDTLCSMVEPNVCNTRRRVEVLEEMHRRGIPTVVWLTPVLPYINDTMDNIRAILEACRDVQVRGIICFGMGLTLREGDREYYYAALDRHFPGIRAQYVRNYGNAYVLPSPNSAQLMECFTDFCREHDILYTPDACFGYMQEFPASFEQLSMFG